MISLQTNVDAMDALSNLNVDNTQQSQTIQQLSSGYRINSSADDPAGLAIANSYQNEVTQLNQGVSNANDGIAQLQIIDGGLSNISNILNQMQTLATQSASGTFTGSRTTLNQEYQDLTSEITRQASNINLNAGGSFNSTLSVFIGGANSASNASVSVDLSGNSSAVDATSLGLAGTSVIGGGTSFSSSPATNLNDPNAKFVVGSSGSESFAVQYTNSSGQVSSQTVTINGTASGISGTDLVNQINTALSNNNVTGVSAQIGSDGSLQFTGGNLLTVTNTNSSITSAAASNSDTLTNSANYTSTAAFTALTDGTGTGAGHTTEGLQFTVNGQNYNVNLTSDTTNASEKADTISDAVNSLNTQLQGSGITASSLNGNIVLQSANSFNVTETSNTPGAAGSSGTAGTGSVFGTTTGSQTVTAPTQSTTATGNATLAITAINNAIQALGLVQGRVGAGEKQLQYASSLAQSQITNVSTAESDIKDADVAQDASNLTKSQVLEQTAISALAQANSETQNVLKLLQG